MCQIWLTIEVKRLKVNMSDRNISIKVKYGNNWFVQVIHNSEGRR